jgi:hypothetical protein
MAGPLYRLLYCSRNVIAHSLPADTPIDMEHELRAILEASRKHNQANHVTGALLFTASGFAQVLEGYREPVERTFDRISADPRHADVSVLAFTPTERRSFPNWPMAFCGDLRPGHPDRKADPLAHLMSEATVTGERATTGGDLLRLLEKLVRREDEWMTV